ncbi:gamma-mobile-trio recombinase GmtY [Ralstonia nicotianae]
MSLRRELATHHIIVHALIKKPGLVDRRHYALYILDDSDGIPSPMIPLVEYFIDHGRSRSPAWERDVARSVGLFVDYLSTLRVSLQDSSDRPEVLAMFAEALVGGTVDRNGDDSTGLYWEPKTPSRAMLLLNAVTAFSDWLVNRFDTTPLNPWRSSSMAERIAYWRRFDKRRARALLAHTYGRDETAARSAMARTVSVRRKLIVHEASQAKCFPQDRIWDLLREGCAFRGRNRSRYIHERLNVRDMLITILLHGGGLRESEPFHLYVSDVRIDPRSPDNALVRIYHPERGSAPEDYTDPLTGKRIVADREEYLRVKWSMEPRNLSVGRFHAGWKDLKLTDGRENYALVHWFPSYWGEVFLTLFKVYITQIRSRHCRHPFLFVSQKEGVAGAPYTVDAFRQAHGKMVERIGLVPRKELGTTPHGHRHAYAQLLSDLKVDEGIIQAALHHKSPDSQQVYKEPTATKVNAVLQEASQKISAASPSNNFDLPRL